MHASIPFVVTGGAGPPQCGSDEKQKSYDYLQKRKCGLHFTLVKVTGVRLDSVQ